MAISKGSHVALWGEPGFFTGAAELGIIVKFLGDAEVGAQRNSIWEGKGDFWYKIGCVILSLDTWKP